MNNEPTTLNQEKEQEPKYFAAIADELILNKELQKLPGDERASVIVDRFIGAIVRRGDVQGRKDSFSPMDITKGMDYISTAGVNGLIEITSTDGLRGAVRNLGNDGDVARLFGQVSSRFNQDAEGKYTLTSAAQIEGYLLAGGEENIIREPVGGVDMQGDSWIPVLVEQTQRMAEDPNLEWMTDARARDLTGSSGELIKNTGRDWLTANSSARKAGVDVDLLRRSAEKVQSRTKDNHAMGSSALFLATGGGVNDYRRNLDRRSGY